MYSSLGSLDSGTFNNTSIFLDLVWSTGIPPYSDPFISNVAATSQPIVWPTITIGQMTVSIGSPTPFLSSTITAVPPLSGKSMVSSKPRGRYNPLYVPPLWGGGPLNSRTIPGAGQPNASLGGA